MTVVRHSQRHRDTSLPFKYAADGIDFQLEHVSLDGSKPRDLDLKPGESTVDLAPSSPLTSHDGADDHWDRATLYGKLELDESVLNHVLPPEEHEQPPAKLYVAVRCHDTIHRDRTAEIPAPVTPGTYDTKIMLDWDTLRGSVELRPYLVRTEQGGADPPYATQPNVKIASGQRFEIYVDETSKEEPTAIDGEEVSFSAADHLPDTEKLYHLDFRNESRPKLWINADHPRITDVLQTDGSVGAEPRLRDVILDQIAYGVWTQLVVRTAVAVDRDGEVEYEWQRNVLESFGRELYDVDNVADAAQLLREDVSGEGDLGEFVGSLDHELQEFVDPRKQLINLMEEGLQI